METELTLEILKDFIDFMDNQEVEYSSNIDKVVLTIINWIKDIKGDIDLELNYRNICFLYNNLRAKYSYTGTAYRGLNKNQLKNCIASFSELEEQALRFKDLEGSLIKLELNEEFYITDVMEKLFNDDRVPTDRANIIEDYLGENEILVNLSEYMKTKEAV